MTNLGVHRPPRSRASYPVYQALLCTATTPAGPGPSRRRTRGRAHDPLGQPLHVHAAPPVLAHHQVLGLGLEQVGDDLAVCKRGHAQQVRNEA